MKRSNTFVGCSSYNESYWKGIFYPEDLPRKDWFSFYCQYFKTYEMNSTFYKFPTKRVLTNWYEKSPDDFVFSVKMYKGVTHFKRFNECQRELSEFYSVCRDHLKEKLACILFQLPPSFQYSSERLQLILDALDYSFTNAIEFRHSSWWREEVYEALRDKNVVFCNVSYPDLPEEIVATSEIGYTRLHGVPKLFYSGYGKRELTKWRDRIAAQTWKKNYLYFNNTASQEGIRNALDFDDIINKRDKRKS